MGRRRSGAPASSSHELEEERGKKRRRNKQLPWHLATRKEERKRGVSPIEREVEWGETLFLRSSPPPFPFSPDLGRRRRKKGSKKEDACQEAEERIYLSFASSLAITSAMISSNIFIPFPVSHSVREGFFSPIHSASVCTCMHHILSVGAFPLIEIAWQHHRPIPSPSRGSHTPSSRRLPLFSIHPAAV